MLTVSNYNYYYRFNCGRMFAYSDDDGSISRFLLAEKVPLTFAKSGTTSALGMCIQHNTSGFIQRYTGMPWRSPRVPRMML